MSFGLLDFNLKNIRLFLQTFPRLLHLQLLFTCSAKEPCETLSSSPSSQNSHGLILQCGLARRSEIQRCAMRSGAPRQPETGQGCANRWKKACKVETRTACSNPWEVNGKLDQVCSQLCSIVEQSAAAGRPPPGPGRSRHHCVSLCIINGLLLGARWDTAWLRGKQPLPPASRGLFLNASLPVGNASSPRGVRVAVLTPRQPEAEFARYSGFTLSLQPLSAPCTAVQTPRKRRSLPPSDQAGAVASYCAGKLRHRVTVTCCKDRGSATSTFL